MSSSLLFPIPSTVNTKVSLSNIQTPTAANAIPMNNTSEIVLKNQTFQLNGNGTSAVVPYIFTAEVVIKLGANPTMTIYGHWMDGVATGNYTTNQRMVWNDGHTVVPKALPGSNSGYFAPVSSTVAQTAVATDITQTVGLYKWRAVAPVGLLVSVPTTTTWPNGSATANTWCDFIYTMQIDSFDGKIVDPSNPSYVDPGFYYNNAWH